MVFITKSRYLKTFSLFKNSLRNNSVNVADSLNQYNEETTKTRTHVYRKTMTKPEIVDFLIDSVVYNKDNVIVTNKPYGVGKLKPKRLIKNYVPQTFNDFYLEDILPEVAEKLGFKSLQIAKAPERYASGVIILTGTEKAREKISNSIQAAQHILPNTYITVTLGHPIKQRLETKFALKKIIDKHSVFPVVLDNWSKKSSKQNHVKLFRWKHKVLAASKFTSLVQIEISNIHWDSLKLYMATKCLSPVLGDILFGWRVKEVMGVPLLVDPESSTAKVPKEFDPELLSTLQISQKEVKMIPSHVHLQSVTLPFKKGINFFVSVPPPESFVWTCQQLELAKPQPFLVKNS